MTRITPKAAPGAPEFAYRGGALMAEGVALARIAAAVGTPVYVYSSAQIERRYREFAAAFAGAEARLCYSIKANPNLAVVATLARLGAGADVVSEGEFRRALQAGIPGSRIIFSGVGKTAAELEFALAHEVSQINVESLPELEALSEVAARIGKTVPIAIRVNPDVDARTHAKITTGKKENKFGIDLAHVRAAYARAAALPGVTPVGIAVHIGSQLTNSAAVRARVPARRRAVPRAARRRHRARPARSRRRARDSLSRREPAGDRRLRRDGQAPHP